MIETIYTYSLVERLHADRHMLFGSCWDLLVRAQTTRYSFSPKHFFFPLFKDRDFKNRMIKINNSCTRTKRANDIFWKILEPTYFFRFCNSFSRLYLSGDEETKPSYFFGLYRRLFKSWVG